jgi:hypothetical protein
MVVELRSNGLAILLAGPATTQAWGHQAYPPRSVPGTRASPVERCSRALEGRRPAFQATRAAAIPC